MENNSEIVHELRRIANALEVMNFDQKNQSVSSNSYSQKIIEKLEQLRQRIK